MVKNGTLILFTCFCLIYGCKSSNKTTSNLSRVENSNQSNDLKYLEDKQTELAIKEIFEKIISEQLNLNRIDKTYDTSKPTDSVTGKPPLLSETEIKLSNKTDTKENYQADIKENALNKVELTDKGETQVQVKEHYTELIEKNTEKEYVIFLKWIGAISIISVVLGVICYFTYKQFRRRGGF